VATLTELLSGAWELPGGEPADLGDACAVVDRYQDQDLGIADASLVILARRYRTDRVLTLDHRHVRVVRTADGNRFTILPATP